MATSRYANDEYTIGWITALHDEFVVAMAMLDEHHGRPQHTPTGDRNAYHLGQIGGHKVVMACLLGGKMGTAPAAIVAVNMRRTFQNIRFTLMVGIGGGVPSDKKDIRLGDVVVSYPVGGYNGIVQYDYGKLNAAGDIERKGWFRAPPHNVLDAVDLLRTSHFGPKPPMNHILATMDVLGKEYAYSKEHQSSDRLFRADSVHRLRGETCAACDVADIVPRATRALPYTPRIHYGTIASGNMVIKDGIERDKIDQRYDNAILCFEMEGAGLMNNFPCLVIRGISDYSDSHKNDLWRKRAIAAASSYAKVLLSQVGR